MKVLTANHIEELVKDYNKKKRSGGACTHPRPRFGKTRRDKATGAWANRFENRAVRNSDK